MYQERISRVLAAMERMGLEQMLVSDPDSIWYLTGYDVFPFERLYAFYLRKDGQHKLFLNKLFPVAVFIHRAARPAGKDHPPVSGADGPAGDSGRQHPHAGP